MTATRTRKPKTRTMRWNETGRMLEIRESGKTGYDLYMVDERESQSVAGVIRVFEVRKVAGETHLTTIGDRGTCTCRGHKYTGHCRHVAAIEKLVTLGRI